MRVGRCAVIATILVAYAGAGRAASPLLEQAVSLSGFAMWSDSGAPGLVIGAVRGSESIVLGYGTVRPKGLHPELPNPEPDGRTLVRLGSVSKAFTGELLAGLVVDGRVRLTDALRRYLPPGAVVPAFGGREITLLDLATHSGGLPREMGYAPEGTPPFTWPTSADRIAWLSKISLAWAPGSVAAYSNVGLDLLGDALVGASGVSYATLLQDQIAGPLGMGDTVVSPDTGQCARLMMGTGLGAPTEPVCGNTEATAASGGLYSTANDMVLWLRHLLGAGDAGAWPMVAVSQAVYRLRQTMPAAIGFDEAGPMAGLGLAWVMQEGDGVRPTILEKSGGGGGFMTYVAFALGRGAGVFVAVDRLDFGMFYGLTAGANRDFGESGDSVGGGAAGLRALPGGPSALAQCILRGCRAGRPAYGLAGGEASPMRKPPTGESYVREKPPVQVRRVGRRESFPTLIEKRPSDRLVEQHRGAELSVRVQGKFRNPPGFGPFGAPIKRLGQAASRCIQRQQAAPGDRRLLFQPRHQGAREAGTPR